MSTAAPLAMAQPVPTAPNTAAPISQEQFLSLMGRLDALEKRNEQLEGQIRDLRAGSQAAAPAKPPSPTAASASLDNGRPTLATADGRFTASLRGIVQLDAAHYDQSPSPGPLATDPRRGSFGDVGEADHARDLSDGANFRRVRLGVEGKAWGDWGYNLLFDFGGSGVEEPGKVINAYVEYTGFQPVRLRVGAFAPTTGLEDATPNTAGLFEERAAVTELVRNFAGGDSRTGAAILTGGERWTLGANLTGNTVTVSSFDEQLGFIGRGTWLPVKAKDYLVHVGANLNVVINPAATGPDVDPAGAMTPVRLRERPELRVDGTRLVDTGAIDADSLYAYGLELGVQKSAFTFQGEYFWIDVNRRRSALPDPNFNGWYGQVAYTLSGQPRRYNVVSGGFDQPRVEKPFNFAARTWGVWELAARYSDLDLDYRAGAPGTTPVVGAIRGGEQRIFTVGLNWYPNNNVRFLADYQSVDVDRLSPGANAFGAGALTPAAGLQVGQTLNIWSLRTQYAF